eukprot:125816-Pyramimonas_sp.AAC.1
MLVCDARCMRADPKTKGSIGRELKFDSMAGELDYVHPTVRLSEERLKKTVPSCSYSELNKDSDGG